MKLYTEEQVRKAWNTAFTDALSLDEEDYKPKFFEDFIDYLTPIELPNDEEIDRIAPPSGMILTHRAFKLGARWMRDKIKKGK